jgi:hypothetical protein
VELLELPIRFRVLGRVDAWIRSQLAGHTRVELLGRYGQGEFAARAGGCDLALFLSPWPETYCITFDEWARSGRACFFIAIGALAEAHRQQALHPATRRFEPGAVDAMLAALIQAATPAGLAQMRRPWTQASGARPSASDAADGVGFGERHWRLFALVQALPKPLRPLPWQNRPHQCWGKVSGASMALQPLRGRALWRARLRRLVYGLPAGHRLARRWRQLRGG